MLVVTQSNLQCQMSLTNKQIDLFLLIVFVSNKSVIDSSGVKMTFETHTILFDCQCALHKLQFLQM